MDASGDVDALLNHLSEEWQKEGFVDSVTKSLSSQEVETENTSSVAKEATSLMKQVEQHVTIETQGAGSANVHSYVIKSFDTRNIQHNDFFVNKQLPGVEAGSQLGVFRT